MTFLHEISEEDNADDIYCSDQISDDPEEDTNFEEDSLAY